MADSVDAAEHEEASAVSRNLETNKNETEQKDSSSDHKQESLSVKFQQQLSRKRPATNLSEKQMSESPNSKRSKPTLPPISEHIRPTLHGHPNFLLFPPFASNMDQAFRTGSILVQKSDTMAEIHKALFSLISVL